MIHVGRNKVAQPVAGTAPTQSTGVAFVDLVDQADEGICANCRITVLKPSGVKGEALLIGQIRQIRPILPLSRLTAKRRLLPRTLPDEA
jgi:hypothetical protein